jgi:hypothetical protein
MKVAFRSPPLQPLQADTIELAPLHMLDQLILPRESGTAWGQVSAQPSAQVQAPGSVLKLAQVSGQALAPALVAV